MYLCNKNYIRTWCRLRFINCFNNTLLSTEIYIETCQLVSQNYLSFCFLPGKQSIVVTSVWVCTCHSWVFLFICEKRANCIYSKEKRRYTCPTTTIVFNAISHVVSHLAFTWWQRKKSSSSTNKSVEERKDNIKMMGCGPYITDCETEKEIDYNFFRRHFLFFCYFRQDFHYFFFVLVNSSGYI